MNLLDYPLYSQLLTAVLSCCFLIKNRSRFLKLLTFLLVVTFFVELLGNYLSKIGSINFYVYHYYILFQYVVIFFLYKSLIKHTKYLIIPHVLMFFFTILWVLVFFDRSFFRFAVVIGSFNVGVIVFLYLRELLLSDKIINYKKLLPFWASVGFIVFHLPSIPFFSFWSYMKNKDLYPILLSLIVLMNLIISFGLVWSRKKE